MSADAILGTFVNIKTMADGTPRLVLDLQCGLSEVAAMGLIPGVPFAIARLSKEAAGKPAVATVSQPEAPKERPGQICVMAVNFCKDPLFWKWINSKFAGIYDGCANEDDAKAVILDWCRIDSRRELDTNKRAKDLFLFEIRAPFLAWRGA